MTEFSDTSRSHLLSSEDEFPSSTSGFLSTVDNDDDLIAADALNNLENNHDVDSHAKMMQHAKETYNSMDYWAFLLLGELCFSMSALCL